MTLRDRIADAVESLGSLARRIVALPLALLPRRWWDRFPGVPVSEAAALSGLITAVVGAAAGARGFLAYAARAASAANAAMLELAARQTQGLAPGTAEATSTMMQSVSALSVVAFTLATPLGWLSSYLVLSGVLRAVSASVVGQPFGDPLLTGIDTFVSRRRLRAGAAARQRARAREEGPDVPDRLIAGEACGLPAGTLVVIAARRKDEWTSGATVVTPDGWYRLADPFDVDLPQGLRTAYPLTKLETIEVLRRGVRYALPPLQRAPGPVRRR